MSATSERAGYGVRCLDGDTVELCSQCGFDGRRYPPGAVVDALGAMKWQWHEILGGDDSTPQNEVGADECTQFDPEVLGHELGANADALAELIAGLTPEELGRPGSVGEIDGDVLGIARHAVHDATHHVLDARRGFAAILLRADGFTLDEPPRTRRN